MTDPKSMEKLAPSFREQLTCKQFFLKTRILLREISRLQFIMQDLQIVYLILMHYARETLTRLTCLQLRPSSRCGWIYSA